MVGAFLKVDMITIAIDLDEVLGGFIDALILFHNEAYGSYLQVSDFFSYTFREVWGGTEDESKKKINEFFQSRHFNNIKPIEGAREGVQKLLDSGFRLVVVTSRQTVIERQTKQWIDANFPNMFSDIRFGNIWSATGTKTSKPDLCRQVGASFMIDDSLSYSSQCAEAGFKTLLFDLKGLYRWNQTDSPLPPLMRRVTSWEEAVNVIVDHYGEI